MKKLQLIAFIDNHCMRIYKQTSTWQDCKTWIFDDGVFARRWIENNPAGAFLGKGVLKIYSKFTGERPCQSVVSCFATLFKSQFGMVCSPANLLMQCNVNLFNVERKKLNTSIIPGFKEANQVRLLHFSEHHFRPCRAASDKFNEYSTGE